MTNKDSATRTVKITHLPKSEPVPIDGMPDTEFNPMSLLIRYMQEGSEWIALSATVNGYSDNNDILLSRSWSGGSEPTAPRWIIDVIDQNRPTNEPETKRNVSLIFTEIYGYDNRIELSAYDDTGTGTHLWKLDFLETEERLLIQMGTDLLTALSDSPRLFGALGMRKPETLDEVCVILEEIGAERGVILPMGKVEKIVQRAMDDEASAKRLEREAKEREAKKDEQEERDARD
jgi:hypothetical protein